MRKAVIAFGAAFGCCALLLGLSLSNAATGDEGEVIKQVMVDAHKSKLLNRVVSGAASDEEKKKLLGIYLALWSAKPEKGDQESWNKLTGSLITAAGKVVVGQKDGVAALKKASNCKACHSVHK